MQTMSIRLFLATLLLSMWTGITVAQDDLNFDDLFGNGNGDAGAEAPAELDEDWDEDLVQDEPEVETIEEDEIDPSVRAEAARALRVQEELRLERNHRLGLRNFEDGKEAFRNERWTVAINLFDQALDTIEDVPEHAALRREIRSLKSEAFVHRARNVYNRRRDGADLSEAEDLLRRAEEANPANPRIALLRRDINVYRERVRTGREVRPIQEEEQYRTARENAERLMARGRRELGIGDFDAAERSFEEVLRHERYNTDALRYIKRVSEERVKAIRIERETSLQRQIEKVERGWLLPRRIDQRGAVNMTGFERAMVDPTVEALEARLADIMIPNINFQSARIQDVIETLVLASRENDPEGHGVNIIFMDPDLADDGGRAGAPAAAPQTDIFGMPVAGGDRDRPAARAAGQIRPITLSVRNISLLDALQLVTEIAGLYYRIERNIVIIDRIGAGRFVTRFYPVDPARFTTVTGTMGGGGARRLGGGADPFGAADPFAPAAPAGGGGGDDGPDVRALFERYGVRIPEGGDIAYEPMIAQLVVTLTPDQFPQFEEVLAKINVSPRQVEIEARFVEVLQRDLDQVGVEWILNDDAQLLVQRGPGPVSGRPRIQADANSSGLTGAMRFFDFDAEANSTLPRTRGIAGSGFNPVGDILSLRGVLTNPELQMIVHAIDQKGSSDLLSAPRITTINGTPASIEVVTEIIYPTEFTVETTEISGGVGFGAADGAIINIPPPTVTPGAFETRSTGVLLNVTPTVAADNYTINLALRPEIAELVDWLQYGSNYPVGDGTEFFTVNMPQPVFASRNVSTSMIVWDGHTVVMGGLIREDVVRFKDKVPLLGDLPIIGRLFRSEGSRSEKRNLLIFVTARLVDPAGNSVNPARPDLVTGAGR
jgi:general secretion pathway protein D